MDKLMNASQAAEIIGIKSETLRKWVRNGTFPGKIITEGRELPKFLIAESDVKNFTNIGKDNPDNPHSIFNNEQEFMKIEKRFDSIDNKINDLRVAVFEQIHNDKRHNQDKNIESLMNNQTKLYARMDQILNQFEHFSKQIEDFTIMKQINSSSIPASMQTSTSTSTPKQRESSWAKPNIKDVRR